MKGSTANGATSLAWGLDVPDGENLRRRHEGPGNDVRQDNREVLQNKEMDKSDYLTENEIDY